MELGLIFSIYQSPDDSVEIHISKKFYDWLHNFNNCCYISENRRLLVECPVAYFKKFENHPLDFGLYLSSDFRGQKHKLDPINFPGHKELSDNLKLVIKLFQDATQEFNVFEQDNAEKHYDQSLIPAASHK